MARRPKKPIKDNDKYVLPATNKELQTFIAKYKPDMTEQVVSSIEYAVKHKLPIIEVFQFKNSRFVVTVTFNEYDVNLENIYNYYLDTEQYELCKRVVKLRDKLNNTKNETKKKNRRGAH